MIDITPKNQTRFGRITAFLKAWDEAIHFDPTELLQTRIRNLETRVSKLEALDVRVTDNDQAA